MLGASRADGSNPACATGVTPITGDPELRMIERGLLVLYSSVGERDQKGDELLLVILG